MRLMTYLFLAIILLHSCKKEELFSTNAENHFSIENDGAIMPVLVRGNTNSGVFIITLHGGPGDSGLKDFGQSKMFEDSETDYAFVYFDQRCAGISHGTCDPKNLNVSDFVEDLDHLILVIEEIYGSDNSIFILGHSWGATLGMDFLVNGKNKSKINGFILTNGPHDVPQTFLEQKDILAHYANQQIGLGNSTKKWQHILDESSQANPAEFSGRLKLLKSAYQTQNLFIEVDSVKTSTFTIPLSGLFRGLMPTYLHTDLVAEPFFKKVADYKVSSLNSITVPTAIYWGKMDMVVPPNIAKAIFSEIGSTEKELFFLMKSFHAPMLSENDLYQVKVKSFVERHK